MKDKEAKSVTKQLTRYAKVGGVVGKLATKLASQRYLGVKLDTTNSKLDQLIALYQEGGIVQMDGKKVGDVLGRQIMKPSIA